MLDFEALLMYSCQPLSHRPGARKQPLTTQAVICDLRFAITLKLTVLLSSLFAAVSIMIVFLPYGIHLFCKQ